MVTGRGERNPLLRCEYECPYILEHLVLSQGIED